MNNVVLKSTRGLYHHLSDLYSDGKNRNDFRKIFGYVFEEYVGKLLNCSLKQCDISPEIKFRIKKNEVKTIDWIVKNNEKLLLIEVKQSSINQKSKNSGNIDIITENFNNIVKSVKQINKTIEHIKSNKYKELKKYEDFRMVQGLIVINDPLYNSSYLCRDIVKRNINLENINIISIEEFETLFNQKRYFNKLFTLLMKKSRYNHDLDMNEYLIKNKFNFKHNNLLKDEFKEFFEDVRIK